MFILIGILILILATLMFCFPHVVYSITELWKSEYSGEPSDMYKIHIRIKSLVFFCLGIFFIVAFFLIP